MNDREQRRTAAGPRVVDVARLLACCLVTVALAGRLAADPAPVDVKAAVDKTEVTVGDPIQYTITVSAAPTIAWTAPDAKADVSPFEVRDYKAGAPRLENGQSVTDITFTLALFKTGAFTLNKLAIRYRTDKGADATVAVPPVTVTVKSVLPPGTTDIKDIRGPQPAGADPVQWGLGILIGLALAAAIVYFVYRRYHRKSAAAPSRPAAPLTDWEIAVRDLDALREVSLTGPDEIKAFHIRITEITRRYIVARYRIPALEETTSLIYYNMRRSPEARGDAADFRDLLAACDLVKFAKYRPVPNEAYQMIEWARKVVLNSRRTAPATETPAESGPAMPPLPADAGGKSSGGGN
jgi:hypothetical protein